MDPQSHAPIEPPNVTGGGVTLSRAQAKLMASSTHACPLSPSLQGRRSRERKEAAGRRAAEMRHGGKMAGGQERKRCAFSTPGAVGAALFLELGWFHGLIQFL